jgi:hypothetical protein
VNDYDIERYRRQDCIVDHCMPVVIERRCDGLRQLALVAVDFNLAHILDGEWFAPKLPVMDTRP